MGRNWGAPVENMESTKAYVIPQKRKNRDNKKKMDPKLTTPGPKTVAQNTIVGMAAANRAVERYTKDKVKQLKDAEAIVKAMALPLETIPVRIPNSFTAYPTAIAKPYYRKVPAYGGTGTASDPSRTACFLFRDPYRGVIMLNSSSDGVNGATYQATNTYATGTGYEPVNFGPLSWISGPQLHGPTMYPGYLDGGNRTYYYAGTLAASFQLTNSGATPIVVNVWTWRGDRDPNLVLASSGVAVAAGATVTLSGAFSAGCYIGFDFSSTSSAVQSYTLKMSYPNTPASVDYGHFSLPYMDNNTASADAVKVYAASMMYTNTASPLNRQGKIVGVQIPRGRYWANFTRYSTLSQMDSAVSLDSVNGIYGFLKPTQPEDFNFLDESEVAFQSSSRSLCAFKLIPPSDFLVVAFETTVSGGADGYFTTAWGLEYRTVDSWRDTRVSEMSTEEANLAIKLVARMPQWHENPFHFSDIINWLSDKASDAYEFIKAHLPGVVSGLNTAAAIGSAVIPLL